MAASMANAAPKSRAEVLREVHDYLKAFFVSAHQRTAYEESLYEKTYNHCYNIIRPVMLGTAAPTTTTEWYDQEIGSYPPFPESIVGDSALAENMRWIVRDMVHAAIEDIPYREKALSEMRPVVSDLRKLLREATAGPPYA